VILSFLELKWRRTPRSGPMQRILPEGTDRTPLRRMAA
jgi:hypothetical protein